MHKVLVFLLLALLCASPAWAANTHGRPDVMGELQSWFGDGFRPYVISGTCTPAVPASSLSFGAFACKGYVRGNVADLVYVSQLARTVGPFSGGDGLYWLALHRDTSTAVASWTRQQSTVYLWQKAATQPSNPPGALVFGKVTVAGGVITAYGLIAATTPAPVPSAASTFRKIIIADFATGGDGLSRATAWTGWETSVAWSDDSDYEWGCGFYAHSATIPVPKRSSLHGWPGCNQIEYTGSGHAFDINPSGDGTTQDWSATLYGLHIVTKTGSVGVYFKDVVHLFFDHLTIRAPDGDTGSAFTQAGLQGDGTNATPSCSFIIRITNNIIQVNQRGIWLMGCNNHNDYTIIGNRIQANLSYGIQADNVVSAFNVISNDLEGNGQTAVTGDLIFKNGGLDVVIKGNYFESNVAGVLPLYLTGSADGVLYSGWDISNNRFASNVIPETKSAMRLDAHQPSPPGAFPTYEGVRINGNTCIVYGSLTNAPGTGCIDLALVDGTNKIVANSDFTGNNCAYEPNCQLFKGALSSVDSYGNVLERKQILTTLNFPSLPAGNIAVIDVTIPYDGNGQWDFRVLPRRTINNTCAPCVAQPENNIAYDAWDPGTANTVRVRATNLTSGTTIDPVARDYMLYMIRTN